MTTITDLSEISSMLEQYRGAAAKVWHFNVTHKKLFIRLSLPGQNEVVFIVAVSCENMNGPFSWKNANISISEEVDKETSEQITYLIDKDALFKLASSGGVVLGRGLEPEFDESFR